MSPALTPLVSALERAAALIEKGMGPAKALKQVAAELEDYADKHAQVRIPEKPFELGARQ